MKLLYHIIITAVFVFATAHTGYCAADIHGTVLDSETNKPLIGASLKIKDSKTGAITNIDGRFTIAVQSPGVYVVEAIYIGYASTSYEITVTENKTQALTIKLVPEPFVTETVVVTAAKNRRRIVDSVETINVVTSEEIDNTNATTITNVLREVPGVSMNHGPNPDRERPEIRGMGGERVLLSIDGAKMNLSTMNIGDTHVVADDIERIEIVKGPSSALYGSSAMGGVINIITKEPRRLLDDGRSIGGKFKYTFNGLNAGSTENLQLYGVAGDFFDWKASITRRDSKYLMLDDNNGSKLDKGRNTTGGNVRLDGIFRINDSDKLKVQYERYSYDPVTEPGSIPKTDTGKYYDYRKREYRRHLNQAIYTMNRSASWLNGLEIRGYRQLTDVSDNDVEKTDIEGFPPIREIVREKDDNELTTYGLDIKATSLVSQGDNCNHVLTYGAEYMFDSYHQVTKGARDIYPSSGTNDFSDTPDRTEPITEARSPDTEYRVYSAYIQDEILLGDRFIIIPGLRFDAYEASADKKTGGYDQSLITDAASQETALSPKMGIVAKLSKNQSVTLNIGRGFRVPSKGELYYAFNMADLFYIVPNPKLKPETCTNYELSHKMQTDRIYGGTGVFFTRYNDFIGGTYLSPLPGEVLSRYQFSNKDRVDMWGIESSFDIRLVKSLGTSVGFTYHRGKYKDTGKRLEGLHKPKITFSMQYAPTIGGVGMKFTAGGRCVGAVDYYKDIKNAAGEEVSHLSEYGGYTTFDVGAGFTFNRSYRINIFLNNVFDKEYKEFSNLLLPSPGRYASISFSATY